MKLNRYNSEMLSVIDQKHNQLTLILSDDFSSLRIYQKSL